MEKLKDRSIENFAAELATAEPMPGCGCASAAAGALAAALGSMAGAMAGQQTDEEARAALNRLEQARAYFIHLVDEDVKAFQPMNKYVLGTAEDDPSRKENMEGAVRLACYIPTEVMYTSASLLEPLGLIARLCPAGALAEVGAAVELAMAALRCARLNILSKAALMCDEVYVMTLHREGRMVLDQYTPLAQAALKTVEDRLS